MLFPKRTSAQKSGEVGVNVVSKIVTDNLEMIFRRIPQEHDFGLDAYIDFVSKKGFVTGGSVGVQIKYGQSYFKEKTPDGYWYSGSIADLNYFLNQANPIFIFLVQASPEEVFWAEFDANYLHKSGRNWKIFVPKSNTLRTNFSQRMRDLCVASDFSSSVRDHLAYKAAITKLTTAPGMSMHIGIRKESIEQCDTSGLLAYFEGLKGTKKSMRRSQGKVSFFVKGYDEDPRELFEIPEVVSYFEKLEPEVKYWFYFLSTDKLTSSLQTLMAILCRAKLKNGPDDEHLILNFDDGVQAKFFERNFLWLNEVTEFLGLAMEENKRISEDVLNYYRQIWIPEKT